MVPISQNSSSCGWIMGSSSSSASSSTIFKLPNITKFKIGVCQLAVSEDKDRNLRNAHKMIKLAAENGAKLVVLPEMWNCPYSNEEFGRYAEDFTASPTTPSFSMLSKVASSQGITIVGGSIPERDNGLLYNTCCVFGPDGSFIAKHRKMHLFDIDIPGDISFKESDTLAAGDTPTIVDTDVGRIGIGICHDIRFPELAMLYRARGAHLICYPGAFNMSTGQLLWELMQRARAADNQLYVATCSPSRNSTGGYYSIWGHSTVVGPAGDVIATSGHEESVVIAEIDYSNILLERERSPLQKLRRENIYRVVDIHNHSDNDDQMKKP